MSRAKEILLEESKKHPNFGLLTGTMPCILTAMETYAKEKMIELVERLSKNEISCYSVKRAGEEKKFFLGKDYVERVIENIKT